MLYSMTPGRTGPSVVKSARILIVSPAPVLQQKLVGNSRISRKALTCSPLLDIPYEFAGWIKQGESQLNCTLTIGPAEARLANSIRDKIVAQLTSRGARTGRSFALTSLESIAKLLRTF
jgi:hypothetical protein